MMYTRLVTRMTLSVYVLMLGCTGQIAEDGDTASRAEETLLADYERQTIFATGPTGERLVAGLYPDFDRYYSWGCRRVPGEPTVNYEDDEIELSVTGFCTSSYRHDGAQWRTSVDGFFRAFKEGSGAPNSGPAAIEFGIDGLGFAGVTITRVASDGSRQDVCRVELDSLDPAAREDACMTAINVDDWYEIEIDHAERLPGAYQGTSVNGGPDGTTINASVEIQFDLPWGLGVEHFTDFDQGGEPIERMMSQRGCPVLREAAVPPPAAPGTRLSPGLEASYFRYDPYACAILDGGVQPICSDTDTPNFSIVSGATGSPRAGDLLDLRYDASAAVTPGSCAALTAPTENWAAQLTGYLRLQGEDGTTSSVEELSVRMDGDIDDGLRIVIYDGTDGASPNSVLCTVSTMWNDSPGHHNYQSISARPWSEVPSNDCERGVVLRRDVNYPITVDYYHHQTGRPSWDDVDLEVWWSGVVNSGLRVGIYH